MKKKLLIINADDFGLCHSANAAVFDLFETGCIKSSTIMTPCPGADEAIAFAAAHPEYAIGVHLTHTNEWKISRPTAITPRPWPKAARRSNTARTAVCAPRTWTATWAPYTA